MNRKTVDFGIIIGKELHELLLEEDDNKVIENKRNQLISVSDDLAKEILDALILKDKEITSFLNVNIKNCDAHVKNCKTLGDLIIKTIVIIILRSFADDVTHLGAGFYCSYSEHNFILKKRESHISRIEETVFELYGTKMKIELSKFESGGFELYFSWH